MSSEFLTQCRACRVDITFPEGVNVFKCPYCERQNERPRGSREKTDELKLANALRDNGEFDDAHKHYMGVLSGNYDESEAWWGLLLCKYGVMYVEDNNANRKERLITCRRSVNSSFRDEPEYRIALEKADLRIQADYERDAKYIDQIQAEIRQLRSRNEKPYDVFLCYKETAPEGGRTEDSVIAENIYRELTRNNYRVFYAPVSLREKAGANYEAAIFLAIESSRVMIAIGTKKEYFESTWVRSEWRRFLVHYDEGRGKLLIPLFRREDDMPSAFITRYLQGYEMKGKYIRDIRARLDQFFEKKNSRFTRMLLAALMVVCLAGAAIGFYLLNPTPTPEPVSALETAAPQPMPAPTAEPTAAPTLTLKPTEGPTVVPAVRTWICNECGAENREEDAFCNNCAAPKEGNAAVGEWTCSICQTSHPFHHLFCTACGRTRLCLECGESILIGDANCANCGVEAGKWKCADCAAVNDEHTVFCENCGTKRHTPGAE